jgi:hypothetical protein
MMRAVPRARDRNRVRLRIREACAGAQRVTAKRVRSGGVALLAAIDIAQDRRGQFVCVLCVAIGLETSVKRIGHLLDPVPDADVAHAQLAQALVELDEQRIDDALRQVPLAVQALQHQPGMERQKIEASVQRIGHREVQKEHRLPRARREARAKPFRHPLAVAQTAQRLQHH